MRPFLIGVAGPSCAGKSEISNKLSAILNAPIVNLDSYYRDLAHLPLEARAKTNFDAPESMDHDLLISQVRMLARGVAIEKPVYDFTRHTPAPETELVVARDFAIVEGLFALYWPELRRLFNLRVFVSVDDATCFARRLGRDVRERGRTPESVERQYAVTVRPMAEKHVLPTSAFADIHLDGCQPIQRSAAMVLDQIERNLPVRSSLLEAARTALFC